MPPVAQLASRLTPRGWLIVGGGAVAAILFIYLFLHTVSQPELHDARQRRRPLADGQDDEHAERARHQLPAAEQRHRARRAVQPDRAGARRARRRRPARQHPARLRAVRQTEPRRKQLPAAGDLPARAAGTARSRRSTACRASPGAQVELVLPSAQNQVFGETPGRLLGRGAAVGHDVARLRARCAGIAQLVASSVPGPAAQQGHDHRRLRAAAVAARLRGGSGGSGTSVQDAEQRYDQSTAASLDAMLAQTLGAGQGAGARVRQHERRPDDQGIARIRQGRRAPAADARSLETLSGNGAAARRATGTANLTARPRERRQVELQEGNDQLHARRRQDRHPLDDRAGHRRKPARLGAARPLRARLGGAGDQGSGHERRRHPDQARRHDLDRPDRVREGGRRGRGRPPASMLGYAKYVLLAIARGRCSCSSPRARCAGASRRRSTSRVWLRELEAPMRLSELERETRRPRPMAS